MLCSQQLEVLAARPSPLPPSTSSACSRAIFERVHVNCTCFWRFSCSIRIFSGVGMCVVYVRVARGSLTWSQVCNTGTVSIYCSPLRPTSRPFLKCKNLFSNIWRFLLHNYSLVSASPVARVSDCSSPVVSFPPSSAICCLPSSIISNVSCIKVISSILSWLCSALSIALTT